MQSTIKDWVSVVLLATALFGGPLHGQTVREFPTNPTNVQLPFTGNILSDAIGRPGVLTPPNTTPQNAQLQLTIGGPPQGNPTPAPPDQDFAGHTWSPGGDHFTLRYDGTSVTFTVPGSPPLSFTNDDLAKAVPGKSFNQNTLITILARGRNTTQPMNLTGLSFAFDGHPAISPGVAPPPNSGVLSSPKAGTTTPVGFEYLTIGNILPGSWTLSGNAVIPGPGGSNDSPRFELAVTTIPLAVQLGQADFPIVIYNNPLVTSSSILKGDVISFSSLTFDQSNDGVFKGNISGTGSVIKTGDGAVALTSDNTYSGGTTVNAGTLIAGNAPGSMSKLLGVSNALGVGDVTVQGGILRTPSFKTGEPLEINVGRNYTQGTKGTLVLGIGARPPALFDHVAVGGDASLAGTLVVSSLDKFSPEIGDAFLVLHTGGTILNGSKFSIQDQRFNTNNLQRVDIYTKNGVVIAYVEPEEEQGERPGAPDESEKPPPSLAENVPERLPPLNPEQPFPEDLLVKLLNPNAEQLTALFEIPFSGANIQRFNLDDRMTQIQRGPAGFVSPPPPAPPPATGKEALGKETAGKAPPPAPPPAPAPRWGLWANGWGDFVHIDDSGFAKGYRFTTGGMSAGIDYRITDHFAVGLFGGYSHTWMDFRPGDGEVDTGRGGLYATYFDPTGWWVNAGAWGGYNSYSTSRQGLLGLANGSTEGYELSTFGDAGYNIYWGKLTFGPIVSMQYTTAHISGFTERGSLVPLDVHADSEDSLRTDLGAQASYNWQVGKIVVVPGLRLAWQHEFKYSNLPLTASAPALGGATANFSGPNLGHDSLLINANVGIQINSRISATIGYDGQVARHHYSSHAVTGTFSFSF